VGALDAGGEGAHVDVDDAAGARGEMERELRWPLAEVEAARSELLARLGDLRAAAAGR